MNDFIFKYEGYIKACKWKSIFVGLENVLGRQNRYINFYFISYYKSTTYFDVF